MSTPRTKFTSPFARLQLSETGIKTLELLSRVIVNNYVVQYEQYVDEGGSAGVDEHVWKLVKQRDSVHVFTQRKSQSDSRGVDGIRESIASYPDSGVVQPPDLPMLLTIGSVTGVRWTTSCGQFADAVVLKTIVVPEKDDSFQSLAIKWSRNRLNLLRRSILGYRDFVYLDRTGITYTSSERNQVEMVVRGIADPSENAPKSMTIRAGAEMYIAISKYVECSYRKKFMWRLHMKQQNGDPSSKLSSDTLGVYTTCKRMPSRISSMLSSDSRKCRCALCSKYICSSCWIKKTLSQVASASSELWQREFAFCSSCYREASRSDAFTAALQEFVLSKAASGRAGRSFHSGEDLNSISSSSQGS